MGDCVWTGLLPAEWPICRVCLAEHRHIYCTSQYLIQTTYLFGNRCCAPTGHPCATLSLDTAMTSTGQFLHASPSNYHQQIITLCIDLWTSVNCVIWLARTLKNAEEKNTWEKQHTVHEKWKADGLECCRLNPDHLQQQTWSRKGCK